MGATENILFLYFNCLSLYYNVKKCEHVLLLRLDLHPFIRVSFSYCTRSAHEILVECTRKPVIVKLPSENWRAQVRRKGKHISNTFRQRADADTWALETERTIDKGFDPTAINPSSVKTFGEIIDLHVQDTVEVGKIVVRSQSALVAIMLSEVPLFRVSPVYCPSGPHWPRTTSMAGASLGSDRRSRWA
jgi:hypothetical protein